MNKITGWVVILLFIPDVNFFHFSNLKSNIPYIISDHSMNPHKTHKYRQIIFKKRSSKLKLSAKA